MLDFKTLPKKETGLELREINVKILISLVQNLEKFLSMVSQKIKTKSKQ
jgi:hypothetical protein